MKQFNLGRWFGTYWVELQNSMGLVGLGTSLMNMTVFWAIVGVKVQEFLPWLSYPLFMGIVFFIVLVALPYLHWTFMYAAPQQVASEQSYKHNNPFKDDIDHLKDDTDHLKEGQERQEKKLDIILNAINTPAGWLV